MQIECWRIHGNSFHFGQHGIGQESSDTTMHSDSLFSALVAVLAQQEGSGAVQNWMNLLKWFTPIRHNVHFSLCWQTALLPSAAQHSQPGKLKEPVTKGNQKGALSF